MARRVVSHDTCDVYMRAQTIWSTVVVVGGGVVFVAITVGVVDASGSVVEKKMSLNPVMLVMLVMLVGGNGTVVVTSS